MELWELRQRQSLPLDMKVRMTERRIRQWFEHWNGEVYVAFSGGKDSTVLLDIVRHMYPKIPAVFMDTGLEYPEIREFVRTFENVAWLKPEMSFKKVLEVYGFPVISKRTAKALIALQNPTPENENTRRLVTTGFAKNGTEMSQFKVADKWMKLADAPFRVSHKCCDIMKKNPAMKYGKETGRMPIIGMMASESKMREKTYMDYGCNTFEARHPQSNPMSFWVEQNVLEYITERGLPMSDIYGEIQRRNGHLYTTGAQRTGCMFCMFGVHLEKPPNRFQMMAKTHPKQWNYCIKNLGLGEVLDFIEVDYQPITTLDEFEATA